MPEDESDRFDDGPVFTSYGIASAVLGMIAVAAVALATLIWSHHRADVDELQYRARAMEAAADWTNVLINMNSDTVDASLAKLHEGTVGQLNADFEAAIRPYRELVQKLKARTTGQIDSVAVETLHHEQPNRTAAATPSSSASDDVSQFASRTDTVMVVATSVSENVGDQKPQTVRWTLRLDVSDVDGKLMISRLEPIR